MKTALKVGLFILGFLTLGAILLFIVEPDWIQDIGQDKRYHDCVDAWLEQHPSSNAHEASYTCPTPSWKDSWN